MAPTLHDRRPSFPATATRIDPHGGFWHPGFVNLAAHHDRSVRAAGPWCLNRRAATLTSAATVVLAAVLVVLAPAHARAEGDLLVEDPPSESGRLHEEMLWMVEEDPLVDVGSKRAQRLSRSPVNVQVFTAQQIRDSGARNLGEFLRRVPSVRAFVATSADTQVGAARSASVSGFQFVEVLLDGRSVRQEWLGTYFETPLPIFLADIDRVEVVQGPDGAIYGPGGLALVIDIKTRDPADKQTEGTLAQLVAGGPTGVLDAMVSHGFALGAVKSKLTAGFQSIEEFDEQRNVLPDNDGTSSHMVEVSLRNVLDLEDRSRWEVDGSFTNGDFDLLFGTIFKAHDASERSALVRHQRELLGGDLTAQVSWTEFAFGLEAAALLDPLETTADRVDGEVRQTFELPGGHHLLAGLAYQFQTVDGGLFTERESLDTLGIFASDEWQITDELSLSASARVETLHPAGTVVMPGGALVWRPAEGQSLRLGVGRGVAAPPLFGLYGRFDVTPIFVGSGPDAPDITLLVLRGNRDLDYQDLTSYEAGYRGAFWDGRVYTQVEAFVEDVGGVVGFGPVLAEPAINIPFANRYSYWAAGTEASFDVKPVPWLTFALDYAFIDPFDQKDRYGELEIAEALGNHRGVASVEVDFRASRIPEPWLRGWHGAVTFEATSDGLAFPLQSLTAYSLVDQTQTVSGTRLLNARLAWTLSSYDLDVAIEGWNLLDQKLPIWGRGTRIVTGRVTIGF